MLIERHNGQARAYQWNRNCKTGKSKGETLVPRTNSHPEELIKIIRQVAFASGLFQGDLTIKTLLESLAEGVVIIDSTGTILFVNSYAEQMFGYDKDELLGKPHADLIPERLRDVHKAHEAYFFAEPKIRPMGKLLALLGLRKDDSEFPLEISLSFIETINGILVMAFISDVTERKRFEDEIMRLNAELEKRATELEIANRELEAFNYSVAHDLRQPLNLISMCHQGIEMLCGDRLQAECKEYVEKANRATFQMNNFIDTLLRFSQVAHTELHRETVDMSALAHEVITELKLTDPDRQVLFQVADRITVNADASLLRVVLDNLLGNAWKYSRMRDKMVIEFGLTEIDGISVHFIRDNGIGFDMAEADKLFVPFQRLSSAKNGEGFGVGLATVVRIINRHGGRVWAESELDKGTTFFFTLHES